VIAAGSGVHFDGVLDTHVGTRAIPFWSIAVQGFVNWAVVSALLLAAGMLLSKSKPRPIDILGTQALARAPLLLSAFMGFVPGIREVSAALTETMLHKGGMSTLSGGGALLSLAAVTLGALVITVWMVVLMYRGFAVSCNVKGKRAVMVFAAALLGAELLSKAAIYGFLVKP
jgi:hypothetical protein